MSDKNKSESSDDDSDGFQPCGANRDSKRRDVIVRCRCRCRRWCQLAVRVDPNDDDD